MCHTYAGLYCNGKQCNRGSSNVMVGATQQFSAGFSTSFLHCVLKR